jgi:hypothetical protein
LRNRHSEHMWFLFEYVFIAASSHTWWRCCLYVCMWTQDLEY